MLAKARSLYRLVFPGPPVPLTRSDVTHKLETVEFLARNCRECLRADDATRFEQNVRFAIEQLEAIERSFDARG